MIGVNDHGFHLHGKLALRRFLGQGQLCLDGLDCRQCLLAAHRGHYLCRQSLAFFIRSRGFGALILLGARRRWNGNIDFLHWSE